MIPPPYPRYRPSGIEWLADVPEHWELRRGKTFLKPLDIRSTTGEEELLSVSSAHGVVPRETANVTMFKAESYVGYKLCWPGDLVINSLWAWAQGLGVSSYHGIVSSAYGVYRASEGVETGFLNRLVRSVPFQWELQVRSKGIWVSRLQMTDEAFLDAPFPLPPLDEQRAIVRYLERVDGRIRQYVEAKRGLIALLEEERQAVVAEAVTRGLDREAPLKPSGVPWLGEVPAHWEVRRLGTVVLIRTGATPSTSNAAYWDGSIVWITPDDLGKLDSRYVDGSERCITEEGYRASATTLAPIGSIAVSTRAPIGHLGILRTAACVNQGCRLLVPWAEIQSEFLHYALESSRSALASFGQGSTFTELSRQRLAGFRIPLPPLDEQHAIVEHLDKATADIDTALTRVRRQIELMEEYRTRLIADVVTGKVDVREAAA